MERSTLPASASAARVQATFHTPPCSATWSPFCDIDENKLNAKAEARERVGGKQPFLHSKKYFDYRKMLDEMGKDIDAVVVSTPDHTHAPASIMP